MKNWQQRFRAHMKRHGQSQEQLAAVLEPPRSQGAIGHWLRGVREINLTEFLALCQAAGADPREILFGETTAEAALHALQATVLATKPDKTPAYQKFEKSITRKQNGRSKTRKLIKVTDR